MTYAKPLTYVFTPLVHCPWGQMQLCLVTRADSFFDAQENIVKELKEWKRSQTGLGRNDYPWLDEAIAYMSENNHSPTILGMYADKPDKTAVIWYDEREK